MALQSRPPVVTIMGHVDHGKTSLLDYIRHAKVVDREAGGITQHIGAYQIDLDAASAQSDKKAKKAKKNKSDQTKSAGKKITFIDTPGHAAFNKMRERGADITDIVVLVVAADDGVKPQTLESIRHIKNSGSTVIVAINKIDKENAYPDMVKAQLAEQDIKVQGYGGSVDVVEVSAKTGKGVDALLETISITAELNELKADPEAPLQAVVIESTLDPRRGAVASVIVQSGTLQPRQNLLVATDNEENQIEGRVRQLSDENGQPLKEVLPGSPAEILGLKSVPPVGSSILDADAEYPEESISEASESDLDSDSTELKDATDPNSDSEAIEFDDLDFDALFDDKPKLNLIIRADVEGTLEAIKQQIDPETVELLSSGVGEVSERDLELAESTGSTIIVFHSKVPRRIKDLAKTRDIKIREYDVIYKLLEDLQKQMLKLMDSTIDEVVLGEAEILQIFEMKGDKIAGCRVTTGEIKKTDLFHLKRDDEIIADPQLKSMMHGKQETDSAKAGSAKNEFGCVFKKKKLDFQVGDILVAYKLEDDG